MPCWSYDKWFHFCNLLRDGVGFPQANRIEYLPYIEEQANRNFELREEILANTALEYSGVRPIPKLFLEEVRKISEANQQTLKTNLLILESIQTFVRQKEIWEDADQGIGEQVQAAVEKGNWFFAVEVSIDWKFEIELRANDGKLPSNNWVCGLLHRVGFNIG